MTQRPRTLPASRTGHVAPVDEDDPYGGRPSKSQLKRDMLALQALGAELVALSKDAHKKMPLPEAVDEAVREARRITDHEGKRRQMQYVGKVMRSLDDEEVAKIRAALDAYNGVSKAETVRLHAVERWRERLLADDAALTEFVAKYPAADVQTGRNLIRSARRDQQQQRPPKHFRELFHWIKAAQAAASASAEPVEPSDDDDDDDIFPVREDDDGRY
ncbi:ribosome-associated protein [Pararobbsia alpina]|uniref:ribosome biogenesis factor YjgA n=1 Tax=Pararobbsia alpina TaxID=621374 RepID=UPI0039A44A0E